MSKKRDVITIIECEGDGNWQMKIANSPDTLSKAHKPWPEHNWVKVIDATTPTGTAVQVAVNFPDLLAATEPGTDNRLLSTTLSIYDEIRQRRLPGEWFAVTAWMLDQRWFKGGR